MEGLLGGPYVGNGRAGGPDGNGLAGMLGLPGWKVGGGPGRGG